MAWIIFCDNLYSRKARFFGYVENDVCKLHNIGEIAVAFWEEIPAHHHNVEIDTFVVMPNHIHGIVHLLPESKTEIGTNVGTRHALSLRGKRRQNMRLPNIIGSYKSAVTRAANKMGIIGFGWQRSYHDRIVRNEKELQLIRNYIANNPIKWELDKYFGNHERR